MDEVLLHGSPRIRHASPRCTVLLVLLNFDHFKVDDWQILINRRNIAIEVLLHAGFFSYVPIFCLKGVVWVFWFVLHILHLPGLVVVERGAGLGAVGERYNLGQTLLINLLIFFAAVAGSTPVILGSHLPRKVQICMRVCLWRLLANERFVALLELVKVRARKARSIVVSWGLFWVDLLRRWHFRMMLDDSVIRLIGCYRFVRALVQLVLQLLLEMLIILIGENALDLHLNLLHQLVLETLVTVFSRYSLGGSLALMAARQVDIDGYKVRKSILTAEMAPLFIQTRFSRHVCALFRLIHHGVKSWGIGLSVLRLVMQGRSDRLVAHRELNTALRRSSVLK